MMQFFDVRALMLGVITGLICTVFDGMLVIEFKCYVPPGYFFILLVFNTVFWGIIGGIESFCHAHFMKKKNPQKNEGLYGVFFFLIPFAALYGLIGRFPIPHATVIYSPPNPVFDNHFSFVWIALIILFLIRYFTRMGPDKSVSPLLFSIEIITFVILFQFCSNPSYPYLNKLGALARFFIPGFGMFTISSYIFGVLGVFGFYFVVFFCVRPFLSRLFIKYVYILLFIILFSVCGFLFFAYGFSYNVVNQPVPCTINNQGEKKAPNVILIVLDALRADRLSIYNKNSSLAKNLELFAKDSLVFERCLAPSSWTLPSHASLFTGLYVSEHKCEFIISPLPILSNNYKTMAEIFRDHEFRTAAVISNFGWLDPKFNIHQGFEFYNCSASIGLQQTQPFRPLLAAFSYATNIYSKSIMGCRTAEIINKEAINIIHALRENPFFLFLNYMDTHTPYMPQQPFDNYFMQKTFPQLYRLKQYYLRVRGVEDKRSWDSFLQSQYDGEITYLDHQLGMLFSHLKDIGVYDSALIIVTADHGDLLGEHGLYEHHGDLYEGVARVPLIIKFPLSKRIGRENRQISLVDILPTIMSICGLPIPGHISGRAFGGPESIVAELYSFDLGIHKIIYEGKYKYMGYRRLGNKNSTQARLYDLTLDPQENNNLVDKYPEITLTMKRKLEAWESSRKLASVINVNTEPLSEDIKRKLGALGYLQ